MQNLNIFEFILPKFVNTKKIRLIELFAGYGSQALALKYLGVDFEHYQVVEFDKKVVKAYNEMHDSDFPAIDIRDVKELECDHHYLNICTYSFPCQDLSKAGKGKGMTKGENTRSGLLWEVERILLNTQNKPQVLLMENVPDVIGTNNIEDFKEWLHELEQMGYSNYVECLNAKNYGIPQNRNRAFMVSIMGEYSYTFPSKIKLKHRLKDMLEDEVDEKYYLSERAIKGMMNTTLQQSTLESRVGRNGVIPTLSAREYKDPKLVIEPICLNSKVNGKQPSLQNRIYDTNAISTVVTTSYQTNVIIPEATKQGYAIANDGDGVYLNRPHQKRGVVQKGMIQTIKANGNDVGVCVEERRFYKQAMETFSDNDCSNGDTINAYNKVVDKSGIIPTITTRPEGFKTAILPIQNMRIRKLTPKECFRLMGVKDSDSNRLTCSKSQKYALAGNSIVTSVLMAIFGELLRISWKSKIEKLSEELKKQQENG